MDNFGCYNADSNHCINIEIKSASEKLYMGFGHYFGYPSGYVHCRIKHKGVVVWGEVNLLPNTVGFITTPYQAHAGPDVIDPAGYPPFVFTPNEPGTYIVEFDVANIYSDLLFFDFTVVDTTVLPLTAINGRAWSRNWPFIHHTGINEGFHGTLYILTHDGMVDSVKYRSILNCGTFQLNYNTNGCLPYPSVFEESRKSRDSFFYYAEHKIFFNNPDSTIFPSGTPGDIIPGSISVTPDCNGHYSIGYESSKSGYIQVFIDIDPMPGVQDVDIQIRDSATAGLNSFYWDGLDGTGHLVSPDSTPDIILTFMNGLVNHPIYDFVRFDTGFVVGLKRPSYVQPKQYWDDSGLPGGTTNLDGCVSTLTEGCHSFPGDFYNCTGFGTDRTINTWWFSGIPDTLYNASLVTTVPSPDSISGLHSLCYIPNQIFTYSLFPNSLTGAAGYEWQLFKDTTLIQSWNTSTSTLDSVEFPGPGLYYLLGNGFNACGSGEADTMIIDVYPSTSANITISASQNTICEGTMVTFAATTANGGIFPVFQWNINGVIHSTNDSVFAYSPDNGDTVTCILFSSVTQCITNNPDTSNSITMTVNPVLPVSISINPSANPVCEGDTVTFTSSTTNKGNLPVYQWFVNSTLVGTNDSTYTYIPSAGDQVYCLLTSSELCATNNPATSDTITMIVSQLLLVGISISASNNPVCEGLLVTFTAASVNGGTTPAFQWQVNGINTGTNNPVFIYTPVDGDLVTCALISNEECITNNPASSNTITMSVGEAPNVSFAHCFDTVTTLNAKPFKLKGGVPLAGTYSGPGVDQITGYFNPAIAGVGLKTISYSYTNLFNCSNNAIRTISVVNPAPFSCGDSLTDIRDNKKYPTVQIGSQCWLAVNLNHGWQIGGSSAQRDNCLVEKYCYNDLLDNCTQYGALYQWDELMRYEDTEEIQGLCPPDWHVPSEADWAQLFAVYQGNAFAGSPLLYTGYSGFNVLLAGVEFFNQSHRFADFASIMWSSTSHGPYKAWSHGLNEYNYSVSYYPSYRSNAFSVRCIRE